MTQPPTPGHHNGYHNGKYEAPHFLNGASTSPNRHPTAPSQERTVFPPDPHHADWRRPAYLLDQFLFFGLPLRRYIVFAIAALGGMIALGLLPGRWWAVIMLAVLLIGFVWAIRAQRKQDFIHFSAGELPATLPQQLDPKDKIPVYVTGLFSVEGKYKRFTQLPGFYRTFATREHALLCTIRDRVVFRSGHWPEDDIGMWYMFFRPELIQGIAWGTLRFGPDVHTALAITYRLTIPPGEKSHKESVQDETLYMAAQDEAAAQRMLADLLWEAPHSAIARAPEPAKVTSSGDG